MLDVDGNGWSSRFHRLLNSGALVIKATIYPEWQSDILIPWYHYVVSIFHPSLFQSCGLRGHTKGKMLNVVYSQLKSIIRIYSIYYLSSSDRLMGGKG